jgi:hypothetical protein
MNDSLPSLTSQQQATSVPCPVLPPVPYGHRQARQRCRTRPIHPELVRHRPYGLRAILTGRVVEETHAKYSLLSFSVSLVKAGEDEPTGT